ncbi:anthranilate phosphoribosyltransferase [Schaalia sp. 19OD2882]|uniref:anthranilate phosphoribosyltransferase n=1 Tax=Schaalia sp. 19OD2882 TaxID=2794089 RepID=UPI001C1E9DAB|nr:anthranilate phosphoribosyltransferase [Schaalia sp. 19OD2882]QWW20646.1 anthranilate phosphoribosyltransferase [Schaalia sp. 19OD2882]
MPMMEWPQLISTLLAGQSLTREDAYAFMDAVMEGEVPEPRLAAALTALTIKGVTVAEVHGLADAMRDHALPTDLPSDSLDIVGTGGDGHFTVNVSTMSALVLAATGVPVVKHGNRASTSASGSADLLEALGIDLDLAPQNLSRLFDEVGIAFLFANKFHPSMRFAAPVRRALAFPTVFNLLGPLTNPARPRAGAFGAANEANARIIAGVCAQRGVDAVVVRGRDLGLDEFSTVDVNQVWHVHGGVVDIHEIDATETFGMARATVEDLRGGTPTDNAAIAGEVFAGRGPRAVRDAVCLNVAAGLVAHGSPEVPAVSEAPLVDGLRRGVEVARTVLDSGKAARLVERWVAAAAK